jgi:hypothetical protein
MALTAICPPADQAPNFQEPRVIRRSIRLRPSLVGTARL